MWTLSDWSLCSQRCGGGLVNRTLRRGGGRLDSIVCDLRMQDYVQPHAAHTLFLVGGAKHLGSLTIDSRRSTMLRAWTAIPAVSFEADIYEAHLLWRRLQGLRCVPVLPQLRRG